MFQCVYCETIDPQTGFNDEHVMPKFLGRFEPLNPKIEKKDKIVCFNCNSKKFSRLERIFSQDSQEGFLKQQLNIGNRKADFCLSGERMKVANIPFLEDPYFNDMFPFLKTENDKLTVDLKSQIVIKKNGIKYIFLIDALKKIKERPGVFKRMKEKIEKLKNCEISIFVDGNGSKNSNLDEVITLLNEYGMTYNENNRKIIPPEKISNKQWEVDFQLVVDRDIGRVLAKIAFNYFIYCALQEEQRELVYVQEFRKIRNFINGDASILLKDIISIGKDYILHAEKERQKRLKAHIITFQIKGNKIVAQLTFFGICVYEITIGDIPQLLRQNSLGCGHIFDPFSQKIFNLSQLPKENLTDDDMRATFGLFKRNRI